MIDTLQILIILLQLFALLALFPAQLAWGLIATGPGPSALFGVGILVGAYGGLAVALIQGARWLAAGCPAPRRNRRRRRVSR